MVAIKDYSQEWAEKFYKLLLELYEKTEKNVPKIVFIRLVLLENVAAMLIGELRCRGYDFGSDDVILERIIQLALNDVLEKITQELIKDYEKT